MQNQKYIPFALKQAGISQIHRYPLVSSGKMPDGSWGETFHYKNQARDGNLFDYSEVQLGSTGKQVQALIFDCDFPDFAESAISKGLVPEPNWQTVRPFNGHRHLVYVLRDPVGFFENSRTAPQKYVAWIYWQLAAKLAADAGYKWRVGITHNPQCPFSEFMTVWGRLASYTLDELKPDDPLPPKKSGLARVRMDSLIADVKAAQVGARYLTLERYLKHWTSRGANRNAPVIDAGNEANAWMADPLPYALIRNMAKSFENWRATFPEDFHTPEFLALQAERGSAGGKKGKRPRDPKSARSLKPWKKLGISRATYYRWKRQGKLPPESPVIERTETQTESLPLPTQPNIKSPENAGEGYAGSDTDDTEPIFFV